MQITHLYSIPQPNQQIFQLLKAGLDAYVDLAQTIF